MNYKSLSSQIQMVHAQLYQQALRAINSRVTIRNWGIDFYIIEFEQNDADRAVYGAQLLAQLAKDIKIIVLTSSELSRCGQFYDLHPQIFASVTQESPLKASSDKTQFSGNYYAEALNKISFTHFV